jgi:AbrB family looped-hinge helix DNA binding protein
MKITTKGQVTIPRELRDRYGLHPTLDVEFRELEDGVKIILSQAKKSRGNALVSQMRKRSDNSIQTDELMLMTRGDD